MGVMRTLSEQAHRPPMGVVMQHLIRSPRLPAHLQELQSLLRKERARRARFYEEMSEGQKVEFINGEVIVQSPAKWHHTTAVRNLLTLLNTFVPKHSLGCVGQEKVLVTLTRNDYEPDIVYFGPEKAQALTPDQMKFPAPDLVVEALSPSTEENDRGIKFLDYAAHGVAEYWIVDPQAEMIEQYVLEDEAYQLRVKTDSGVIRSIVIENFAIPVRAVFDGTEMLATLQTILGDDD
ncbi:MAG: Uma2 family endonuclease [Chloroflexota bacterium]|nr:Uma2 family endonuclease [Chloroflexota bacterium]